VVISSTERYFIELEDLKPRYLDRPERWNDWYFGVNFTDNGTECSLVMALFEGTFMGQGANRMKLSKGPISLKQYDKYVKYLEKKPHEIDIVNVQKSNNFTIKEEQDKITITQDDLTVIAEPKEQKIISRNEKISGELIARPRGPVNWWGHTRNELCSVAEDCMVDGIESLSTITGNLTINGKEIEIDGVGLFEHVWIPKLRIMKIRIQDWIYANFDQLCTYLCHVESSNNNGCPDHFETGAIYLIEEDEYLHAKKITCHPENWVFLKEACRFIPLHQKIRITTDKGTLKLKTTLSTYPQFLGHPRRIEELTLHNITGWSFLFYDAPITIEGKFIRKNAPTIKLTNGKGLNEQQRVFPLY